MSDSASFDGKNGDQEGASSALTQRELFWAWLPLWVSWFAMALEVPVITSAISRLPDPAVNLAALGGILLPVSFIIEAPILMLLSAATALCRDRAAYRFLYRAMMAAGLALTVLHLLIAVTPLYDIITRDILGCPDEVREAARVGFLVMTPWTWAIAYRRFLQGVVIRLGRSRLVGFGTMVRLATNIVTVIVCFYGVGATGAFTGAAALTAGVVAEAAFIALAARAVVRERLRDADPEAELLTLPRFLQFYTPLALTALLDFLIQPLSSGALSRLPEPVIGLALLPVIGGLMFLLRGPGFALNEVVISMRGRSGAERELSRFTARLTVVSGAVGLLFMLTPLGSVWFGQIVKLPTEMVVLARQALWLALPTLLVAAVKSLYGGTLVSRHRTRGISEGTILYVLTFSLVVSIGSVSQHFAGIFIVIAAMSTAAIVQVLWLRKRSVEG